MRIGLGTILQAIVAVLALSWLALDVAGAVTATRCRVTSSEMSMDVNRIPATLCVTHAVCDGVPHTALLPPLSDGYGRRTVGHCHGTNTDQVLYSPLYPNIYRLGPLRGTSLLQGYPSLIWVVFALMGLPLLGKFNPREPLTWD